MDNDTIPQDVSTMDQPLIDDDAIADAFGSLDDQYDDDDDTGNSEFQDSPASLDQESDLEDDRGDEDDDDLDDYDDDLDDDDGLDVDDDDVPASDDGMEEYQVDADHILRVKVNGEDQDFTIGDLQRLAGQEAAITQKAQQVAEQRRATQQQNELARQSYQKLLDRVSERLKPYEGLDLVSLARNPNVTDDQLKAIRSEMKELEDEKSFLEEGLDSHVSNLNESRERDQLARAQEAMSQIEDQASPFYIEGFRDNYDILRAHAIKQGADEKFIADLIDPWTWKVISDSLTLSTSRQKAEAKRKSRKPNQSAKKTKRSRGSNRADTGRKAGRTSALKRLKANPSSERAIADAFGALDG